MMTILALLLDVCCLPSAHDGAKGATLIVAGQVDHVTSDVLVLRKIQVLKGEAKGETWTLQQDGLDEG